MKGFAVWINGNILISTNANKDSEAVKGQHQLPEELEETDKDDSLGGNEEISCGIDDGDTLLEFAPEAIHHAVESDAKSKGRKTTVQKRKLVISITLEELVDKASSTDDENELDPNDGQVGDCCWENAHSIHVDKRVNHSHD